MTLKSIHSNVLKYEGKDGEYSFILPLSADMSYALEACSAFSAVLYSWKQAREKEMPKEVEAESDEVKEPTEGEVDGQQ